jgi:N-formylglutamate deformylase
VTINNLFDYRNGNNPIIATAIHDGHYVREEVKRLLAIDDLSRLREEDPFTGIWTKVAENRIIVKISRFEMDLNRNRKKAVYINPEDAWGLNVWKKKPSLRIIKKSLEKYDSFYSDLHKIFADLKHRFGKFLVLDLHSYNHRREGPDGQPADPAQNPEVNIGTGTMKRKRWEKVINRFIDDLTTFNYQERKLDVRENVKFFGGHLAKWTHEQFPESACVLSVEFKKFFMDEWSGKPDEKQIQTISNVLKSTIPGVLQELKRL